MIRDTHFVWNVDDEAMDRLKANGWNGNALYESSDRFCNDCMVLVCGNNKGQLALLLKVLKY